MAQHDYVIANGTGAAVRSDLNNALAAIVSQNSGATAPATTYAFQFWADTTTGLLKLRNSANSAWVTLFQLDGEWSTLPVENGTAAAPSIYFKDSGTDTGFYSPGTDQIGISTAGTSRLTIDANGNLAVDTNTLYVDAPNNRVGIGSSSPQGLLHVEGVTGTAPARIVGSSTNSSVLALYNNAATTNRFIVGQGYASGTDNVAFVQNDANAALVFGTNTAERMRITAGGLVGIGTTSPGVLLDLSSATAASRLTSTTGTNPSYINFNNTAGNAYIGIESSTGGGAAVGNAPYALHLSHQGAYPINFSTNNALRATIDSSGRLLVGTSTAPTGTNSQYSKHVIQGNTFDGSGSARMAMRVGVGASSLSSGSGIADIYFVDSGAGEYARIGCEADAQAGTNDYPGRLVFSTTADGAASPTERWRYTNNGETQIRNMAEVFPATDNACLLGKSGFRWSAVWAANGTIQTSDERTKTEILDATLGTDFVKSLRPVSYKWIEGGKKPTGDFDEDNNYIYESVPGTRTHWGFIAQEVKQAVDAAGVDFGGWVLTDKDDPDSQQALRYDQFIAPLTKALQEALTEIDVLKAKVAALESA